MRAQRPQHRALQLHDGVHYSTLQYSTVQYGTVLRIQYCIYSTYMDRRPRANGNAMRSNEK